MTHPALAAAPKTPIEAIDLMLKALAGEEVNGAKLDDPGNCTYLRTDAADGVARTCIVGTLFTPEQRADLKSRCMLQKKIRGAMDDSVASTIGVKNIEAMAGGLSIDFLSFLQYMFDAVDLQKLEDSLKRKRAELSAPAADSQG